MCFIACGLSKQCVFRHNSDIDAWRKILPKGLSNKQQYIYGFMVFTLIDIIGLSHYFSRVRFLAARRSGSGQKLNGSHGNTQHR